jgi:Esterase-like activity of phytase
MRPAEAAKVLGGNISGLAIDGSTGLWAVRDSGALLHLDRTGTSWTPSAGGRAERPLRYPGGAGSPDAEGITTAVGDDAAVYVAAERDNEASNVSRNSILRFDRSDSGTLTATREWKLEPLLGSAPANTGIESLAWVPDSVFVAMGFRDAAGKVYSPANYPDHGAGLFATALEGTDDVLFLALRNDGQVNLVGKVATGLDSTMDVSWSAARQELWAVCDSHCQGRAAVLRAGDGAFEVAAIVRPPAGMESLNNEGFAILPTCENDSMLALWSDDSATGGTALREAPLSCGPVAPLAAGTVTSVATTSAPSSSSSARVTTSAENSSAVTTADAPTTGSPGQSLPAISSRPSGRIALYLAVGALVVAVALMKSWAVVSRRRRAGRSKRNR